ncbi:MAG: hypothetical protein V4707_07965 [Pseudomonadota bacterium]
MGGINARSELADVQELEYICSQIKECSSRLDRAYEIFIQLCVAIVGGSIWLSIQDGIEQQQALWFSWLSTLAMFGLASLSTAMMLGQLFAWRRFRVTLSDLRGRNEDGSHRVALPPRFPLGLHHMAMIVSVWAIAVGFALFNPFFLS